MNFLEFIAGTLIKFLAGWLAGRSAAKKDQAQIDTINHDAQVIVNQKQTIDVAEQRHEIETKDAADSRSELIDKLRNEGAIREADSTSSPDK